MSRSHIFAIVPLLLATFCVDAPLRAESSTTAPVAAESVHPADEQSQQAYKKYIELDVELFKEWQKARLAANAASTEAAKQKIMADLAVSQKERRKQLLELHTAARDYEFSQRKAAYETRHAAAAVPAK